MNVRTIPSLLLALCSVFVFGLRAQAQDPASPFAVPEPPEFVVPPMSDDTLDDLLGALETRLPSSSEAAAAKGVGLEATFWSFTRRLQAVRLTSRQEARVLARFEAIAARLPGAAPLLDAPAEMLRSLTVGKVAPEITGRDLDGNPINLSDYRGKVVVLVFSADWCAICRSLYPYQRLMQDLYAKWPFAILGVDASSSPEAATASKRKDGLTYRSFWDEPTESAPDGRISAAWNVRGRPAVYVLDGHGVIRFVDVRYEDLLKGVRQVVDEHMLDVDRATARKRHVPDAGGGTR
jgi:peroxiredoxin